MPAPQLILTIAPDRDGKTALFVSLRNADGTLTLTRRIPVGLDRRLGAFVVGMQAFARQQLAAIESAAIGRTRDGNPAIAVEAAHPRRCPATVS